MGWTASTMRGGVGHLGLTHTEMQRGRLRTAGGAAKTDQRPPQQPAQPRYANYWAPLPQKRHPPQPAQPRHTSHWAPQMRKRHQQEHRPQRPTKCSDPTQHGKGITGDCPGPRKETATRQNVTQGGWDKAPQSCCSPGSRRRPLTSCHSRRSRGLPSPRPTWVTKNHQSCCVGPPFLFRPRRQVVAPTHSGRGWGRLGLGVRAPRPMHSLLPMEGGAGPIQGGVGMRRTKTKTKCRKAQWPTDSTGPVNNTTRHDLTTSVVAVCEKCARDGAPSPSSGTSAVPNSVGTAQRLLTMQWCRCDWHATRVAPRHTDCTMQHLCTVSGTPGRCSGCFCTPTPGSGSNYTSFGCFWFGIFEFPSNLERFDCTNEGGGGGKETFACSPSMKWIHEALAGA